jgi:hypothetical protein
MMDGRHVTAIYGELIITEMWEFTEFLGVERYIWYSFNDRKAEHELGGDSGSLGDLAMVMSQPYDGGGGYHMLVTWHHQWS